MVALDHDSAARACLAFGRLAEAVRRSSLGRLWLHHETARVVAELFSRGAQPMSPDDLLALTANITDGLPNLEEAAARRFWLDALNLWTEGEHANAETRSFTEAVTMLRDLRLGGIAPGELSMQVPVLLAPLADAVLPSVSLALPSEEEDVTAVFPRRLAAACEAGHARLVALERDFARWRSLLPDARSDSRLEDSLVLLGTVHALTPRYVGDSLGLTRQASARLLRRLADLGIVRKATKRKRWLIYLASNAVSTPRIPESTIKEPASSIDTARVDHVLEEAYAALDRATRHDAI
ncbi:MAG: hypothetical protein AAFX52_09190 [Pseudomonadota bacterium]